MHEAGEAEEPGRVCHMGAAEHDTDENVDINHDIQLPNDIVCHEELCTVDDEPGEVTKEKHNDNADKNASKVHLIVSGAVTVGPHMGIPESDKRMDENIGWTCLT